MRTYGDRCGIARALDLVGERWALLVVRELLLGPKRFTDLRAGLPNIGPDVLSQRLRELEDERRRRARQAPSAGRLAGLRADRARARARAGRARSSAAGAASAPVPAEDAPLGPDAAMLALKTMFDAADGFRAPTLEVRFGEDRYDVRVDGDRLDDRARQRRPPGRDDRHRPGRRSRPCSGTAAPSPICASRASRDVSEPVPRPLPNVVRPTDPWGSGSTIVACAGRRKPGCYAFLTDRTRWLALLVLCCGDLMIVLDSTIVNVALPSIRADLGFTETSLAWVVNAYLLTFGGFLLLGGRLGDLFGHRRMFVGGIALFTVSSLACGLAGSQEVLVIARAVQGLGGAVVSAVALSLIMVMFTEPGERAKAMGIFGFVLSGGGTVGVLLGGILTDVLSWHWIFLVNVPIGIAVYMTSLRLLPGKEELADREASTWPARSP